MAMTPAKRKKMEDLIYGTFNILDKTGKNTQKYKEKYSKMSNEQFDKEMKRFLNNPDAYFYLEVEPYAVEVSMKEAQKAADFLKVPLFEHVIMPFANPEGDPVVTQQPVLVGYIHIKRVQQMVSKKNSMSIHIGQRNPKTGMVSGDDKNARASDVENIALIAVGAKESMKELIGARSDDLRAKTEMLKRIKDDGYVSLEDIPSNKTDKVALNTLDVFFTCAGLKTDLVTDGLAVPRTLNNLNKDVSSISSKYNK